MRKLVRDMVRFIRPPDFLTGQHFELAAPQEMKELLIKKLEEEVVELKMALQGEPERLDKVEVSKEIVDVYEVLLKLMREYGFGYERHITHGAEEKRRLKGGFDAGVVLVTPKRQKVMRTNFKKTYGKKSRMFFLNEQHNTHITKAQARKERK